MDTKCNKSAEVNGGTPFAEARGSAYSPESAKDALEEVYQWLQNNTQQSERPDGLAPTAGSPPITAADFEFGCNCAITGWLWDESYSLTYSERVSLGIDEMRYIANLLRTAQGLQPGVVQEFSEEAANDQAERSGGQRRSDSTATKEQP